MDDKLKETDPVQVENMNVLRNKALELARLIEDRYPSCADRSDGEKTNKLREAIMTTNAAIVLDGLV